MDRYRDKHILAHLIPFRDPRRPEPTFKIRGCTDCEFGFLFFFHFYTPVDDTR